MKPEAMRKQIDSLISHILFDYKGKPCGIDPINRQHIDIWYGDEEYSAKSVDDVMTFPLFDGKSLNEICGNIENFDL